MSAARRIPYKARGYEWRWKILRSNNYDPGVDVLQDSQGVLNLAGNKPHLRDELRGYFNSRNEDTVET